MRLLIAVDEIAPCLPQPVIVQSGHNRFEPRNCVATQFLDDNAYRNAIASADLLIMQAGGGAVLLALKAAKIPVIVPRRKRYGEVIDDHQLSWARALAATGRVVLVENVAALLDGATKAISAQNGGVSRSDGSRLVELVRGALYA